MTPAEITRYLHEHIAITRQLGASVDAYDGASVRIVAPLGPNLNHRQTAFGGSLAALAILAGWTLVHLALRERGTDARLVIQRSEVDFDAPVDGDLVVSAALPPAPQWERFLAMLERHSRARVRVRGTIGPDARGVRAGAHEGTYVAARLERVEAGRGGAVRVD
jgi:thioesterase domain-containing protein